MKLGITSYAYRWAVGGDFRFGDSFKITKTLNAFDLVDKVSELGLEVLQISENVDFDMTLDDYKRLRELAENRGIDLVLGAAGMDLRVLKKYVHLADLMGAHALSVYPLKKEPVRALVDRIRGFLPFLRDRGLSLSVENSSLGLYTCYELADMFKGVDDELFGACIDTVNSTGILEKPLETVTVLSPHVMSLHLKDYCIERRSVSGFTIFGVPLGKGMLDVKAVLNAIKESGRNPSILLEQFMGRKETEEETLREEEEWVKESVRFARSLL